MKLKKQVKCVKDLGCAQALSMYLVVDKYGVEVATLHVHHSVGVKGYVKRVDVYQPTQDGFAQYKGRDLNAALHGAEIGGISVYDYHTGDHHTQALLVEHQEANATKRAYLEKHALTVGMEFTLSDGHGGFENCYYIPGLSRLHSFGLRVHKVL